MAQGVRGDLDVEHLGIKTIRYLCPRSGLPESQQAARPSPRGDGIEQKLFGTQHRFQLSERAASGSTGRRLQAPAGQSDFQFQKPSCAHAPSPRRLWLSVKF